MDSTTGYGNANKPVGPLLGQDQTTEGQLTAVHEQSFHVLTDAGIDMPFQIPEDGTIDVAQLRLLQETNARVIVEFDGSPSAHGARAAAVRPA